YVPSLAVVLLLLAGLAWLLARWARRGSGLPEGAVVYSDTGGWAPGGGAVFLEAWQLPCKPDYLVPPRDGLLPGEGKSGHAPPRGPHAGHRYQLGAYCALVTETYGRRPAYGLIRYADRTLAVRYTRELETELQRLLDEMRADAEADDVARSHNAA